MIKKTKTKMKKAAPKKKAVKKPIPHVRASKKVVKKPAPKKKIVKKVVKKVAAKKPVAKKAPKVNVKRAELEKKSEALIEKGRARGFITYDEILKIYPTVEQDIFFLEELYVLLLLSLIHP